MANDQPRRTETRRRRKLTAARARLYAYKDILASMGVDIIRSHLPRPELLAVISLLCDSLQKSAEKVGGIHGGKTTQDIYMASAARLRERTGALKEPGKASPTRARTDSPEELDPLRVCDEMLQPRGIDAPFPSPPASASAGASEEA